MGKKNKDQSQAASLNGVANRDIIQRINFLYQASSYLTSISAMAPIVPAPSEKNRNAASKRKSKKKNTIRHPRNASELSRSYVCSMRQVGQKTMVRMDPSIKRSLCKQCDTVLTAGSTCSVRVNSSKVHGYTVTYNCLSCNTARRIPAPPVLQPDETPTSADSATLPGQSTANTASAEGPNAMDIDATPSQAEGTASQNSKPKRRHKAIARMPPLFERKGHTVFRGNEVLQ